MKKKKLKQQIFKIPAVFIGVFILNILLMTLGLSLRQSYSNYQLVILAGFFFLLPPLFVFYVFYKLLKKLHEDKHSYWHFIISNTKRSLVFYFVLCAIGHIVVEHLFNGLVITSIVTAIGIWLGTALFVVLNRSLFKLYIQKLDQEIDIPESDEGIIDSSLAIRELVTNPASGAPMYEGIGGLDICGNPYGENHNNYDNHDHYNNHR